MEHKVIKEENKVPSKRFLLSRLEPFFSTLFSSCRDQPISWSNLTSVLHSKSLYNVYRTSCNHPVISLFILFRKVHPSLSLADHSCVLDSLLHVVLHQNAWKWNDWCIQTLYFPPSLSPQADLIDFLECGGESQSFWGKVSDGWSRVRLPLLSLAHWGTWTSAPKAASIKNKPKEEMLSVSVQWHKNVSLYCKSNDSRLRLIAVLPSGQHHGAWKAPSRIQQWWTCEQVVFTSGH